MGQYTNKGLYNAYDKNHQEREKDDYYATPTNEVLNILNVLDIDFSNQIIWHIFLSVFVIFYFLHQCFIVFQIQFFCLKLVYS